ncbi:glycoside hydrolase family 15 protein [Stakelama tenebrarum]|uniref:Glycoside hydrolase family 15 protein n=1 Tax=Stakelama tenebrarum TaxID=2711215 RepID=A0A6G6Y5Q4_9SPHN|nr:glycoside hydrolase family 15 protein [Sphingosinithalassobacter tenebrarum]QIG80229.1 glycoside hydrolase family 15 protein [Sphingosinithalassobacter tenebrarum]
MTTHPHKRIEDYALIGDGETAALVHRGGAIEWLCMPRFDSEACLAAILGDRENGCWEMAPEGGFRSVSRRYLPDTLILETLFETETGTVAVTDFMPIRGEAPDVVRIVECRSGSVTMRSELAIRFDYGQLHPLVRECSDRQVLAIAGPDAVRLDFDVPVTFEDRWFGSCFEMAEGDCRSFVLTWFPGHGDVPEPIDPREALDETKDYWTDWTSGAGYHGAYRHQVIRSLITLKALTHRPTGGIIAAPTASLPERTGGKRNWDYRYCWLRDATFSLLAMLQSGLREEAGAWVGWLRRAVAGEPIDIQPFYTVGGDRRILEWEAPWLAGFNGATPVRFGNAAAGQCQLDVYGEVLDTITAARRHGLEDNGDSTALVRLLADKLEDQWEHPDAGIWESRGPQRQHVYSKVMCWAAFDRAAKWFDGEDDDASARYRELADKVKGLVLEKGFHRKRNSFVAAFGEEALDAALLRLPLVGFLPIDDPRITGTIEAIENELIRDGYVLRYKTEDNDDGVGGGEGAFLAAGFWLADVYALQGRMDDARDLFERLCGVANDVGLLSEEVGAEGMLGNFPQALSHLSLVATAMNLGGGGPAHERGGEAEENG